MALKKMGQARAAAGHQLTGKQAPDFELPEAGGKMVALEELLGKGKLVLYFYPKDMTPGCTAEACGFRDNLDAIRRLGTEVVGISPDSPESHQKFTAKHALNFTLLSDVNNRVSKLYGVYKKKSLYGREFMGIERTTFVIGPDGIVHKVFPRVKVEGHTAEVIAALKELG